MALKLMYITNNPEIALIAQKCGVDRIWVDLETLGKDERQKNMDTVKSRHKIEDIIVIKPVLTYSEMLVRVNPWNEKSEEEIGKVINAGADIIMLPMWKKIFEVEKFIHTVAGKAKTILLLETKEAVECVDDILELNGIDEIHIGLNDLHLSYGMSFLFEPLSNGIVDELCHKFKKKGVVYGFGGIARIGEGIIPAEKIVMEHYRLGSTRVILSRSFCNTCNITELQDIERVFSENIVKLRNFEKSILDMDESVLEKNRLDMIRCIKKIVEDMGKK